MSLRNAKCVCGVIAVAVLLILNGNASAQVPASTAEKLSKLVGGPQLVALPVKVVDSDGKPVENARIIPWALQSSQGHGLWQQSDKRAQVGPTNVTTDESGLAVISYPLYRNFEEQVRTISVSIEIDHPRFLSADPLHIDVSFTAEGPHLITLTTGAPLDVRPTIDGQPVSLENIYAMWSDDRSWITGVGPEKLADGVLKMPVRLPGKNELLLLNLDGDRVTHFSQVLQLDLVSGEPKGLDVPLLPSVRIEGVLSDNIPRPIQNGRVNVRTLPADEKYFDHPHWLTWVPVRPDGTFTIEGWPADQPLQLIALCDGAIATSGSAPDVVKDPWDPKTDPFNRPQVFEASPTGPIKVEMKPLVRCVVTALDENDQPVAGLTVVSYPNVGWWNGGSQGYCSPLVRGEHFVKSHNYEYSVEKVAPEPFQSQTDEQGKAVLELPAGRHWFYIHSDTYEVPVFLGRREIRAQLLQGETAEVLMRVEPIGSEKSGDWDKLAGVVFGCSTREGERICALPGVQKRMDEFVTRFREAKNQRDPQLLSEAYDFVAESFANIGDADEAKKWREKAAEQRAKIPPKSNTP